MKKKLAGVLAAILVLAMGTTVFASQSPTSQEAAEQKAQQLRDSVSTVDTSNDGVKVTVSKVDADEVADANEKATSYSDDAEVLGMVEIKSDKDFSKGVTLTFYVAGVQKGDNIRILHKLPSGKWEVIVPYVGDGFVRATFYSLSPIAIVKYPPSVNVGSTQEVNTPDPDDSSDDGNSKDDSNSNSSSDSKSDSKSDSDSKSNSKSNSNVKVNVNVNVKNNTNRRTSGGSGSRSGGAATSPKTGQDVPVLPIAAVATLLGAAVVGGKKFL